MIATGIGINCGGFPSSLDQCGRPAALAAEWAKQSATKCRGRMVSLQSDILRLWADFPSPFPTVEEAPGLRERAERLLRWRLDRRVQAVPCSCGRRVSSAEEFLAGPPCLRHAAGRRKTDSRGRPVSAIMEVREKVDLQISFIEPFVRALNEQARRDPPAIAIWISDGFDRRLADHAAIDDIDLLAGRVWLAGVDWKVVAIKSGQQPPQTTSGVEADAP